MSSYDPWTLALLLLRGTLARFRSFIAIYAAPFSDDSRTACSTGSTRKPFWCLAAFTRPAIRADGASAMPNKPLQRTAFGRR